MNKTLLESQGGLLYYISAKRYFHVVKRCIAINPQLSNIARVFEPTVYFAVWFTRTLQPIQHSTTLHSRRCSTLHLEPAGAFNFPCPGSQGLRSSRCLSSRCTHCATTLMLVFFLLWFFCPLTFLLGSHCDQQSQPDMWYWQASNANAYFAVTSHWIEEATPGEWTVKQVLLGFVQMNTAHNGARLGQALYKVCNCVQIVFKVILIDLESHD